MQAILGPKCAVPTLAAAHMQRWVLVLSAYDYDLVPKVSVLETVDCMQVFTRLLPNLLAPNTPVGEILPSHEENVSLTPSIMDYHIDYLK